KVVSFARKKSRSIAMIHFGEGAEKILRGLPSQGPLFPEFKAIGAGHRATEFKRICGRANVSEVTLHSYRYAWAEQAKVCGYPERFAQEAMCRASFQSFCRHFVASSRWQLHRLRGRAISRPAKLFQGFGVEELRPVGCRIRHLRRPTSK